ncbi:hypothetical protein LJC33_08100, partial [Eubacteriales bacterium OttesenSCG-928-N13]|nr:hypothetical protein [Eubacteriales bacterium OttesenSCG-928-N13]
LWMSATREVQMSDGAVLMSFVKRQEELAEEGVMPIRWLAARGDQRAQDVLGQMHARQLHRVAVYDDKMQCVGVLEEQMLIRAAAERGSPSLKELLAQDKSRAYRIG